MNTYKKTFFLKIKYTDDQYKGQGRVLLTWSLVLVKFVYQAICACIYTHIPTYMRAYTYTHMRAAYILFYLFICFLFFVLWCGGELDSSLPLILGFDGLLE